ncbi:hypothetical protein NDU88_004410, partial [Pleurodeles waltl]
AYVTPRKHSKMRKGGVVKCTTCGLKNAIDIHIFMECPVIHSFWEKVGKALLSAVWAEIK